MASDTKTFSWGATKSGNWTDSTKWTGGSGGTVPGSAATDIATIGVTGAAYTVSESTTTTISALTVSGVSATLAFDSPGQTLTVSGLTTLSAGAINLSTTGALTTGTFLGNGGTFTENSGKLGVTGAGPTALSVTSGTFTLSSGAVAVLNGASFTGGAEAISGGTFNAGTLAVASNLSFTGGIISTTSASGLIDTSTITGSGRIDGAITGTGNLTAGGGTLDLTGTVNGPSLTIASLADPLAVSDLKIDGTATSAAPIGIDNANQTLEVGTLGLLTFGAKESITNGTIKLDGGSITDFSGLSVNAAAQLTGFGTVLSGTDVGTDFDGAGTVTAAGGLLVFRNATNLSAATTAYHIASGSNSVLQFDGRVGTAALHPTVTFDHSAGASPGTLDLSNETTLANFNATIDGFVFGDTIKVKDAASASLTSPTTLNVFKADGTSLGTIALGESHAGAQFSVNSTTGTIITNAVSELVPCFCAGTAIRTPDGEVSVEDLAIGNSVVTASGALKLIRWIGQRSYAGAFAVENPKVSPVLIRAGALADGVPTRDLYVSPEHAMYLDKVLVPARELVNGTSIVVADGIDPIRYFHIELAEHDVIFAEGAPTETFVDCDSRAMFDNAGEFARRYAGESAPSWSFCAPVVEGGAALATIQQRLALRAVQLGLGHPQAGVLKGNLELANDTMIEGWAQLAAHPDAAVQLEVLGNGALLGEAVANRYRADLETAGIGTGRHAFHFRLPLPLDPLVRHEIMVRGRSHGQVLPGSPRVIEPCQSIDQDAGAKIAAFLEGAVAQARTTPEMGTLVAVLAEATEQARDAHARLLGRQKVGSNQRRGGGDMLPGKRALVVDSQWPRLDRDAGSQAIWSHICALQELGWEVHFVASGEHERGGAASAMAAAGIIVHAEPAVTSVEDVLRRHAGHFDLVYLHRPENALAYAGLARQHQPRARLLYSVADLAFLRLSRQADVEGRPDLARHARALREQELLTMRHVDVVITHSTYEAALLERLAPQVRVHMVPWAVTPRLVATPWSERCGVAFVGNFGHAPNRDAMHWLVQDVMPLVWARDPAIPCLIAGADLPLRLAASVTDPRVQLLGHVPDLSAVYGRARLAVAPLRFGAGVKGKVLEAFSAGLACIMSPVAAEGFALSEPLTRAVAEDATGMADLICQLHGDADRCAAIGQAGLAMVRCEFGELGVGAALARAIDPLANLGAGKLLKFVASSSDSVARIAAGHA